MECKDSINALVISSRKKKVKWIHGFYSAESVMKQCCSSCCLFFFSCRHQLVYCESLQKKKNPDISFFLFLSLFFFFLFLKNRQLPFVTAVMYFSLLTPG